MKIRGNDTFARGFNEIVSHDGANPEMLMDFAVLSLGKGESYSDDTPMEKAYLLMFGSVTFSWDGHEETVSRGSYLDEDPICLHVPAGVSITVTGVGENSELSVHRTENSESFPAKLYHQGECRTEIRGKGQMNEAGTRIVRTILDKSISPNANLMLGEDVHYPGKWSGFPSHHHPQPEIYFYKFRPQNGFGLIKLGDGAELLEHNDTLLIHPGQVHPQVAAPGYAMYYIWVIRHLPGNPYISPIFEEEHLWVEKPGVKLWPEG